MSTMGRTASSRAGVVHTAEGGWSGAGEEAVEVGLGEVGAAADQVSGRY